MDNAILDNYTLVVQPEQDDWDEQLDLNESQVAETPSSLCTVNTEGGCQGCQ